MCAANQTSSTTHHSQQELNASTSKSPTVTTSPNRKRHSHGGKNAYMNKQQGNSAQKPNASTRNEKRARWAKKSKPVAKPIVRREPSYEYVSVCCNELANKPRCGTKEVTKDPESGKMKDKSKGLGHWRCSKCRKVCKVAARKPEPKTKPQGNLEGVKLDPYPAKLQTPVLTEVTNGL